MGKRCRAIIFLSVLLLVPSVAFAGTMYKWTDAQGNVHFTDNPSNIPAEAHDKTEKRGMADLSSSSAAPVMTECEYLYIAADAEISALEQKESEYIKRYGYGSPQINRTTEAVTMLRSLRNRMNDMREGSGFRLSDTGCSTMRSLLRKWDDLYHHKGANDQATLEIEKELGGYIKAMDSLYKDDKPVNVRSVP